MSKVYFLPFEKFDRIEIFLKELEIFNIFEKGEKIALKIHFGNSNHNNHILPEYLIPLINLLKEKGLSLFLTDTNVLYRGERDDTFSHLELAYKKGYGNLGVPILIAGGLNCDDEFEIEIEGKHFRKLYFAKEFKEFDGLIALSHFKGHIIAGIGGTIKNIGMGCASRRGKFAMHSNISPKVNISICKGCGKCVSECLFSAIELVNKKSFINEKKCKGCAWCIHVCPYGAIDIPWSSVSPAEFQEKLVEYAYGIKNLYKEKFIAINFLINISSDCDCISNPGKILSENIGLCVSTDPVSIDKFSVEIVKEKNGYDVFLNYRPDINYEHQFNYAEKIGFGSINYELITY
ncbi:MAG: DUF362 domain-containing protein [Candidatus Omnitrophica bacterium]|nr:DUF362 domain-containing protein [Candidatus Omnitrophota bacterium]